MFRYRATIATAFIGVSALFLGSCSSPDPLVLSLKSSQVKSGTNEASLSSGQEVQDAKMAYSQDITYTVMNDLPDLGASAAAWSVTPLKDNKTTLKKLATALGLTGDVVKQDGNNFTVGKDDKTGAGLWLYSDVSSAWWSYSSGSASNSISVSPTECPPDAAKSQCVDNGVYVPTPPPVNLPNEATALKRVTQLIKDAGLRVKAYSLTATKSEWSTDVVGMLMAGDVASNISMSVSFGAEGVISYASGPMLELKAAGSYPLISPKDAVKRLSQMRYGLIGPMTRSAVGRSVSSPESDTATPVAVKVPITGVRLDLMQTTLTNDSIILLPAYTFTNSDGDVGTVLGVEEKYFSYGDSEVTDGSEPVSEPGNGNTGVDVPAAGSETTTAAPLDDTTAKKLIGLTEQEAQKTAQKFGWTVRIAMRDGEAFMLTEDHVSNRVNLTVTNGSVTGVVVG